MFSFVTGQNGWPGHCKPVAPVGYRRNAFPSQGSAPERQNALRATATNVRIISNTGLKYLPCQTFSLSIIYACTFILVLLSWVTWLCEYLFPCYSRLCRGQMNDVWSFIIKHVRSAQLSRVFKSFGCNIFFKWEGLRDLIEYYPEPIGRFSVPVPSRGLYLSLIAHSRCWWFLLWWLTFHSSWITWQCNPLEKYSSWWEMTLCSLNSSVCFSGRFFLWKAILLCILYCISKLFVEIFMKTLVDWVSLRQCLFGSWEDLLEYFFFF